MFVNYYTLLYWFADIAYSVILVPDPPATRQLVKRPAYPEPFCSDVPFGRPTWANCHAALALLPMNGLGMPRTFSTTLSAADGEGVVGVPYVKHSGTF